MINVKHIKPGTLLKVIKKPIYLFDNETLRVPGSDFVNQIVLFLDYFEGVKTVNFNHKKCSFFIIKVLVAWDAKKFWIVITVRYNTDIINLPIDMKDPLGETNFFEIVETVVDE